MSCGIVECAGCEFPPHPDPLPGGEGGPPESLRRLPRKSSLEVAMARSLAFQVSGPKRPLEKVERDIGEPDPGQVRVRVEACGVCHSDYLTVEGHWPGISYPRVPGHEIAGTIDALGREVPGWAVGDRVGIGWHGGERGERACLPGGGLGPRRPPPPACRNFPQRGRRP